MEPKMSILQTLAASAFSIAAVATVVAPATAAQQKTVVLVHGAFADGSSWSKIIPLLEAKGLRWLPSKIR
jgi:hypothetical protein